MPFHGFSILADNLFAGELLYKLSSFIDYIDNDIFSIILMFYLQYKPKKIISKGSTVFQEKMIGILDKSRANE